MSSPNPKNWQQRLQDLEAELNQGMPDVVPSRSRRGQESQPWMLDDLMTRSNTWLRGLSTPAKVAVLAGLMVGSLVVVGMVLRLVQLAVQLAILAAIGYLGYRFILAPKSPNE